MNHNDPSPLISPHTARILARIINRIAASFDVATLSAGEAMATHLLLDRLVDALWEQHRSVLLRLYESLLLRLELSENDDPEDDSGPEGDGGESH